MSDTQSSSPEDLIQKAEKLLEEAKEQQEHPATVALSSTVDVGLVVRQWWDSNIPSSPVARNTEAANYLRSILPDLVTRLTETK